MGITVKTVIAGEERCETAEGAPSGKNFGQQHRHLFHLMQ